MSFLYRNVLEIIVISVLVMALTFLIGMSYLTIEQNNFTKKILLGDLPECENTVGTPTGYYCKINNVSAYCKVDKTAFDPHVRTIPFCEQVVFL